MLIDFKFHHKHLLPVISTIKENMSMNETSETLEDIIDKHCEKLHELEVATSLIKSRRLVKDELQDLHNMVLKISFDVGNMRKDLEKMKEQNVQLRELLTLTEALDKKIIHQEKNIPPKLIQDYLNARKEISTETPTVKCTKNSSYDLSAHKTPRSASKKEIVKDCKKTLFNEPEICPMIPAITKEEFDKIPKYIIGRQSLETINSLINSINETIIAKYTILALGKAGAQKKGEINLYLHFKRQQLDVSQGKENIYFFTAEDYYRQTKTKIDRTKLNLIIALRHCKRLREYITKSGLRYIITPRD